LFYIWYFLSASGDFWHLAAEMFWHLVVHQSLAKFQQQILGDPDFILSGS
jgi:hypothetical protein